MSSHARKQLEEWMKTIDVAAERVLDIGGAQLPVKGRTRSWMVKEYKILDLEEPHNCRQKPDMIVDINQPYLSSGREEVREMGVEVIGYDVAFCLEVMEYIWNPVQALKNMNEVLKSGGVLYISFPFIYPLHPPAGKDYLRYTKYGAQKLLEEAGFKIEKIVPRGSLNHTLLFGFWASDGFRYDKTESRDALSDTGCFIKAIKI